MVIEVEAARRGLVPAVLEAFDERLGDAGRAWVVVPARAEQLHLTGPDERRVEICLGERAVGLDTVEQRLHDAVVCQVHEEAELGGDSWIARHFCELRLALRGEQIAGRLFELALEVDRS